MDKDNNNEEGHRDMTNGRENENVLELFKAEEDDDDPSSTPTPQEIWEEVSSNVDIKDILIITYAENGSLGFISNFSDVSEVVYSMERVKNAIVNG